MKQLSIGALSKATGLPVHTLRYYENLGLLKSLPRRPGQKRYFVALAQLHLKGQGTLQALGFTLGEISALLKAPPGSAARRKKLAMSLQSKMRENLAEIRVQAWRKGLLESLRRSCQSGVAKGPVSPIWALLGIASD